MMESRNRMGPWDALAHKNRRQILIELFVEGVVQLPDNPHDEIVLDLKHNHIPKLEELRYIEYDEEADEIRKGDNWETIEPFMRMIDKHEDELPDDWL